MFIAEREGFEPPVPLGTAVFKTAVIDHSTISPLGCFMLFEMSDFSIAVQRYYFFLNPANFYAIFFLFPHFFFEKEVNVGFTPY